MILVLNTGNTHIHIGLFTLGRLRETWKLSTDPRRTADEYALQLAALLGPEAHVTGALLSSDVPRLSGTLARAVETTCHVEPMLLTHTTKTGIAIGYRRPEEVGLDRIANAVGGHLMHGAPLLILDFGTAITLEYLAPPSEDSDGVPVYRGGAILPGMEMAAAALHAGTAKLPLIDLDNPGNVIGRTTAESIQSGLIHGYLGAIGSLVDKAREEIGDAVPVVATGGDAARFERLMPYVRAVEPDLTLYGLRQIYGINRGCPLKEK